MSTRTAGPGSATGAGVGCASPSETAVSAWRPSRPSLLLPQHWTAPPPTSAPGGGAARAELLDVREPFDRAHGRCGVRRRRAAEDTGAVGSPAPNRAALHAGAEVSVTGSELDGARFLRARHALVGRNRTAASERKATATPAPQTRRTSASAQALPRRRLRTRSRDCHRCRRSRSHRRQPPPPGRASTNEYAASFVSSGLLVQGNAVADDPEVVLLAPRTEEGLSPACSSPDGGLLHLVPFHRRDDGPKSPTGPSVVGPMPPEGVDLRRSTAASPELVHLGVSHRC